MTAALVSSLEGLDVLLCEKSDHVGGTTATSAGTIWVPGTRQSREAGFTDNVADAKRYLEAVIGAAPDKRRDAYLETGPQVVCRQSVQRGQITEDTGGRVEHAVERQVHSGAELQLHPAGRRGSLGQAHDVAPEPAGLLDVGHLQRHPGELVHGAAM